jgi:hypothetical protein
MGVLDCIVIGYNDVPYSRLANKHKPLEWYSGKYSTFRSNSVLVNGERKNYMELLNHVIEQSHGVNPRFNAFELPGLERRRLATFQTRFLHPDHVHADRAELFVSMLLLHLPGDFRRTHAGQHRHHSQRAASAGRSRAQVHRFR